MLSRRHFLQTTAAASPFLLAPSVSGALANAVFSAKTPLVIESMELLRYDDDHMVRVRSKDGAEGIVLANSRMENLATLFKNLVVPFFEGKDARQIETLVEEVYAYGRNYKYAGMPFWNCVAHAELAILDMLGKADGKLVYQLFDQPKVRDSYEVYLSTFDRRNPADEYISNVEKKVAEKNVKAVKLKVGGRMSNNADCLPGRTEKLVPLARKVLGDDFVLYVDSNGSYDAEKAIEVGKLLEDYDYSFYEEPCRWQNYDETKAVADALKMDVAGGEQDNILWQWKYMIRENVVDIVQPDMNYNGGFFRALRVAKMAEEAGVPITPHAPGQGPMRAYQLHFCAIVPNIGPFQEYNPSTNFDEHSQPLLHPTNGVFTIPDEGAGWGFSINEDVLAKAKVV